MKLVKRILKTESGQALPMALIMLVLGGLLVVPTLSFMTTNLTSNRVVEEHTSGIYAADAGIQDALWKLGNGVDLFEAGDSYDLTENVNGMTVTVDKQALEDNLYTLRSTARLDGEVVTVITAQALAGSDYSWLFDQVITSGGDVDTSPHDVIYGGVLCEGDFLGDEDQVRTGDITEGATIDFPPAEELKAYYKSTFEYDVEDPDNWYNSDTYTIPPGTDRDNPHMIPPIYRNGDLTITGNGYGKLSGTIYLAGETTGQLWVSPGTTIDLNVHSIFSEYYNNCEGNAINFQPWCTIFGPGCIVAIGNINYQPNLGAGDQLVGANDSDTGDDTTIQDRFVLSKFKATEDGTMSSFQVKCYDADPETPAHVKVAVYDSDGPDLGPKTLLGAVDNADNITVLSAWNPIIFPEITIVDNHYYWLAAISDAPVISTDITSSTNKYKIQSFTGFTFPEEITPATELVSQNTELYMLRGFSNSQEFIFLMSQSCSVNLQPHASFYGSIAGETTVEMQPWCTVNLVTPDDGLEFPGISGSIGGPSSSGNSPPLLNYNIQ